MTDQQQQQNPLQDWNLAQIVDGIRNAEAKAAAAKQELKAYHDELKRRFEHKADNLFGDAQKLFGQITFEEDGIQLQAEIEKTVSWDSTKLLNTAAKLPWDQAKQIFKIELSVSEKTYSTLEALNVDLFREVTAARTVKFGDLKIKLKKPRD